MPILAIVGVIVVLFLGYLAIVVFVPPLWAWAVWLGKNAILWVLGLGVVFWIVRSLHSSSEESYPPAPARTPSPIDVFAQKSKRLANRVKELRRMAADDPAMLDPAHRENYARAQSRQITAKLKKEWDGEYWDVKEDDELMDELREKAPQVLEWLEARRELGILGSRIAVEKRKKPTIDEVRGQLVNRYRVRVMDKFAVQRERIRMMQEARQFLDESGLSPEERDLLETEMWQVVHGETDGNPNPGRVI